MIKFLQKKLTDEDLVNAPKVKRTHCYIQKPYVYDIDCLLCGGRHIAWSEYEGHIWCYDCKKDIFLIRRYSGIFGGPIPVRASEIFGLRFDRISMSGHVLSFDTPITQEYRNSWVIDQKLVDYEIMIEEKLDKE